MAKILIVDDDPEFALLEEKAIRSLGHEVLTAADGVTGLQMIRSERPNLVVLDLMMPGMHGFAVCQEIQNDPALQGVRVLVTSSKAYGSDMKKAKQLGAADYLVKPFEMVELLRRVNELLKPNETPR